MAAYRRATDVRLGTHMKIDEAWFASRTARHPDLWDARRLSRDVSNLFLACDRLEKLVVQAVSRPDTDFYARSSVTEQVTIARLLNTFDGLLRLGALGYGAPAVILGRTLIEDTVALWWFASRDTDEILTRLSDHEMSVALKMQGQTSPPARYLETTSDLSRISSEEEANLVSDFAVDTNLGHRHWTGKSVKDLAKTARTRMRASDQEALDVLIGKPLLLANLLTHNSPTSLTARMQSHPRDQGFGVASRAQSVALVHDALAIGYECMALIAVFAIPESGRAELDDLTAEDRSRFVVLPPETTAGRNEPCPCGSGRKYKKCHGRAA
ncbi:DUF5677 domain-containing protein [Aeromicrobium tamlense]|uniref:SEC-C motif-containing protein n=1 Tax=Aeromicrobium tamlense TaxID=375541 RepID=A0ABX2SKH0_9ACTN|nr:DUF5677 domain-containing protein [Aeromicrobium tamlense]NYI39403.1 hypothetical protein [Aeromicrobium tamlense]